MTVYTGTVQSLHTFLMELNNIHPSIKFTMSHTTPPTMENPGCDCNSEQAIQFLDTSCKIIGGKIITDLYRKETDRNQYLLPSSCHPAHVTGNIPFSLAMRIVRICAVKEDREKRFVELRDLLLARDYKLKSIEAAIQKARNIPRQEALKKVHRDKASTRPVFVINFDPRLPSIPAIVKKHWRTMVQDPRMKEIFPQPPLVAYKRPPNIKDKLIRAKVPKLTRSRPKRNIPGMKRCLNCGVCPFVIEGKTVKSRSNNTTVDINTSVSCTSSNVVYLIGCKKCTQQYIGETDRTVKERFLEHKGYVTSKMMNKSTGEHFNQQGHRVSDMTVTVLEKIFNQNPQYRKQREKMWINRFNTKYKGLNKMSGG